MPRDPGETWLALTFSLNRLIAQTGRHREAMPPVTNEIVAARRLFPLRQINFDEREKAFCVIELRATRIPGRVSPAEPQGNAQRLGRTPPVPLRSQLLADLSLMPSDGFSFQARSIVRMSARRLPSATARNCAIVYSFVRPRALTANASFSVIG
jgi:hypothetical protein